MESTSAMLATTKYITEPLVATGRYFSRARVIFSSVISASFSRVLITPEVTWEEKTNGKLGQIKSKKNSEKGRRQTSQLFTSMSVDMKRDLWETTAASQSDWISNPKYLDFKSEMPPPPTPTRLRFQSIFLSLTQLQINSVTSRLRHGKIIWHSNI